MAIGYIDENWKILFRDSGILSDIVIFDQDRDGNKEISILAETTATQGPIRKMISAFKWNGNQYSLISSQLMPGITRVEYLDDAQRVLDQGDIALAIAIYWRASYDDSLHDYASRGEWTTNEGHLAGNYQVSFALFRLYALWLAVGDVQNANQIIDDLTEQFPKDTPGHEFSAAANIFHKQISQGSTPKQACDNVTNFFNQNYPDLNIHIGDWGSSVVYYTQLKELCPFH